MQIQNLKNKLSKLSITFKVVEHNHLNHSLVFSINSKEYEAGFYSTTSRVDNYSHSYGYDQSNQETQRRFFDNFNQVIRHSER